MVKRIEVIANIAVILASLLLSAVLVAKYCLPNAATPLASASADRPAPTTAVKSGVAKADRDRIQPGTRISLPGIDWKKNTRTLLLALSTTCHFCSESAALYKQLDKERNSNLRLIAVLPQPVSNSKKYLSSLDISVDEVAQVPLGSLGVKGTPTLILVDQNGIVVDTWRGKLGSDDEAMVINRIR